MHDETASVTKSNRINLSISSLEFLIQLIASLRALPSISSRVVDRHFRSTNCA